jgi:hypothetical protein
VAIVPIHRHITQEVLTDAGFGSRAVSRGSDANAKVDEKQGRTADETNLHSMRGYLPDGRMQTREEPCGNRPASSNWPSAMPPQRSWLATTPMQ